MDKIDDASIAGLIKMGNDLFDDDGTKNNGKLMSMIHTIMDEKYGPDST